MKRSVAIAYALAAVFVLIAIVDLAVRPLHYERTLAVAAVVAVAAGVWGRRQSSASRP